MSSVNNQKALCPIIPAGITAFATSTTAAEVVDGSGNTFGQLYGGKFVTIKASSDSIYVRATYTGLGASITAADTDDWVIPNDEWTDFYVPHNCRLSAEASANTPNLLVAITSQ